MRKRDTRGEKGEGERGTDVTVIFIFAFLPVWDTDAWLYNHEEILMLDVEQETHWPDTTDTPDMCPLQKPLNVLPHMNTPAWLQWQSGHTGGLGT